MLLFIEEWLLLWTMAYHYAGQCDKGRTICCQSHDIATINTQYLTCDKNIHQSEEIFTLSHTTFDMWPNNMRSVTLHRHYKHTTSPQHHHNITTTSPLQTHNIQTCHACSFNIYKSYNITNERNYTIYYFKSFHYY